MNRIMKLVIDSRETKRIEPAIKYYEKHGLEVSVEELLVGDYLFSNGENEAIFEFKRIDDFIHSINDGRVFNQTHDMAEQYHNRYVLIHGTEAERSKYLAISKNYRKVTIYQYLNAISRINKHATVIECYSPYLDECFFRMQSTATKLFDDKPIVKKFPRKHKNPALNYLSYCIYGLNYKRAKLIVDTYNLHSLNDLMTLDIDKLTAIEGIGESTGRKIISSLQGDDQ